MERNNDFRYDLKVGQLSEEVLAKALDGNKIEVKTDLQAYKTGNVYVEYFSRGKSSGIATSEAEWYAWFLSDYTIVMIKADKLKERCKKHLGTWRDKVGGDSNTSKGILLPLEELIAK